MRLVLRSALEAVYVGLGFLGFLALAGITVRDRTALSSAAALAIVLGIGHYVRARRRTRTSRSHA
jgi:hypothetical protein